MSASLHVIQTQLPEVAVMLRRLADDIEAGEYGYVSEAVVVANGDSLRVFGFGEADGPTAHYLLGCGMAKLQRPTVERP